MRFSILASLLSAFAATAHGAPTSERLNYGISQEPDTLNPLISTMSAAVAVRNTVWWPMATVNEEFKWECWLCVRIPSIENGDAKVVDEGGKKKVLVTWEIKPEIVWGDGKPVTGEDMKLTWKIGTSPNVTKASAEPFEAVEDVIVDAQNPRRFTLKYKELRYDYNQIDSTFAPLPSHIEGPIWEKTKDQPQAYEKQTAYITDPTNPGLYNGGYRVADLKPSSHVLVVRNEKFGGKAPQIKSILFKVIPNTQTLEANLVSGGLDMLGSIGFTFDQALAFDKRLKKEPALGKQFRVLFMDDLIFEHLDANLADPILADVRVRKALMHAVDRTKMCQALFELRQKPAAHPWHPMAPYYTDDVEQYPFDLAKAESLLDAAGWKKGEGGIRTKDGQRLSLQIMSTAGNKMRELVEVFLQEAWKKAGIELSIKNEPARVFFGETLHKLKYGQLAMYASTWTSPDDLQSSVFDSRQIPSEKNAWGGSNYMSYKNPAVDGLLDQARTELDPTKRKALMQQVIKTEAAELPQLPLYYRAALEVVPTNLKFNQGTPVDYGITLKAHKWTIEPVAH